MQSSIQLQIESLSRSSESSDSVVHESEKSNISQPSLNANAIYEGTVRHCRNEPRKHQFDFRFFMMLIDLDKLDSVFRFQPFWSAKRWALCRLKQSDHLKKHLPESNLRCRVLMELESQGIANDIGPIRLLTQFSYLGFRMNPVSFYYCYDRAGEKIEAVVVEVNNTPWGEQHVYVIPGNQIHDSATVRSGDIKKEFHVSPFFDLKMNYRMAFSVPAENLAIKIENHSIDTNSESKKLIDVTLALKRRELTSWNLNALLIRYPIISFRVFAGIYWQALRLYFKKIAFVPHPKTRPESECGITNTS